MIKASVIIPIYNTGKKVLPLLNELKSQCNDNIEILLINDCSSDNTLEILKKFLSNVHTLNIKLISLKKNHGVSYARNIGIQNARGRYLIFVDSDDEIRKNFLEKYVKTIELSNNDIEFFSMKSKSTGKVYPIYSDGLSDSKLDQADLLKLYARQELAGYPFLYISKRKLWSENAFNVSISYQEDLLALIEMIISNPNIKGNVNNSSYYIYSDNNKKNKLNNLKSSDYWEAVKNDLSISKLIYENKKTSILYQEVLSHILSSLINLIGFSLLKGNMDDYYIARKKYLDIYHKAKIYKNNRLKRNIQYILLKYNFLQLLIFLSRRKMK